MQAFKTKPNRPESGDEKRRAAEGGERNTAGLMFGGIGWRVILACRKFEKIGTVRNVCQIGHGNRLFGIGIRSGLQRARCVLVAGRMEMRKKMGPVYVLLRCQPLSMKFMVGMMVVILGMVMMVAGGLDLDLVMLMFSGMVVMGQQIVREHGKPCQRKRQNRAIAFEHQG